MFSCNGSKSKIETTNGEIVAEGDGLQLQVDTINSIIKWKGSKIGGDHTGVILLKGGQVTIKGDTLVAGSFIIDMNTINDLDLTESTGKKQLEDHLKGSDFFDVAQYPESKFEITSAQRVSSDSSIYRISGNLTLKGVVRNLTFDANISKEANNYKAATVPFVIDRTEWGVNYGSKSVLGKLKDNIIDDDIELEVTVIANVPLK